MPDPIHFNLDTLSFITHVVNASIVLDRSLTWHIAPAGIGVRWTIRPQSSISLIQSLSIIFWPPGVQHFLHERSERVSGVVLDFCSFGNSSRFTRFNPPASRSLEHIPGDCDIVRPCNLGELRRDFDVPNVLGLGLLNYEFSSFSTSRILDPSRLSAER